MDRLPIFPLSTVLYPEGRLLLRIFEVRYVDMTHACLRDEAPFGVCLILEGHETGKPAVPATIGCTARIDQWEIPGPGLFTLDTRGEQVFRIQELWVAKDGLLSAEVEYLEQGAQLPLPESHNRLAASLQDMIADAGEEHFPLPHRFNDTAWVCHRLAELLPLGPAFKQRLLETGEPADKLALIDEVIEYDGE